jgi:hypothetical protein
MSSPPPAPMSGHFWWSDGTETHVTNIFTDFAQIPKKGFLIGVFRYIDPVTLQELEPKIGHWVGGRDNYYFFMAGAGPNRVEYAVWDGNTTGNTRVTVYELNGFNVETSRTDVRANTFPSQRVWSGVLISDSQWETTRLRSLEF